MTKCDGCGKPLGFGYTRECATCDRTYCEACLNKDPNFSADADVQGDPPRFVDASSFEVCVQCAPRANARPGATSSADESHNEKEGKE